MLAWSVHLTAKPTRLLYSIYLGARLATRFHHYSQARPLHSDQETRYLSTHRQAAMPLTNGSTFEPFPRSETTGSTPPNFVPPPDRSDYHLYRLQQVGQYHDWIDSVELEMASALIKAQPSPPRFLVLYGSLRETSYSRLLAFEMARLLEVAI